MNRKNLNIIEKRVDRLAALVKPRPKLTNEQERIIRVAVALSSLRDMPPYGDQKARKEVLSNLLNTAYKHQDEIDRFGQKEFENRVCRLRRTLSEMSLAGYINPILIPFEQRIEHLLLNPPKWLLRGPIKGSPWGIVEIDGKRYAGIYSTSYWTEADLAVWENRCDIIRAARERVPQIPGRQLHKNIFMLIILPERKKNIWKCCLKPPARGFFGLGHQVKNLLYEILALGVGFAWSPKAVY